MSQYSCTCIVAYTFDVVPSGTIPPTTSTSALSPTPTAPSETAGELTLVLKTCLYSCCVCFRLSQTSSAHHLSYMLSHAATKYMLPIHTQKLKYIRTFMNTSNIPGISTYVRTHTHTHTHTHMHTYFHEHFQYSRQCLCILHTLLYNCNNMYYTVNFTKLKCKVKIDLVDIYCRVSLLCI